MKDLTRRNFVKNASLGAAAVGLTGLASADAAAQSPGRNPREVYIASLTMHNMHRNDMQGVIQAAIKQMEIALPLSPDVYCLPEVFHAAGVAGGRPPLEESSEDGSGNIIGPFQAFAKKNKCYVICPVYTRQNDKYYNAAVVIDRLGNSIGEYRKVRLTEGELRKGLTPGPLDVPVFKTDFGVIGIQICFDIEWPEGWNQLSKKGAEVVFFPSAFSGGTRVTAKAIDNRYCVVSSIRTGPSKISDVTGDLVISGGHPSTEWGVLGHINLEREILHTHSAGTVAVHFPDIRKKYGRKIGLHTMGEEHYTIIESFSADIKIADVMEEFGLRSYRRHLQIPDELKMKLGFANYE